MKPFIDDDIPNEELPESVRNALDEAGISAAQFFMNAADTRTRGIDVVATWDVPFVATGDLGLKFLATVSETEITTVNLPAGLPAGLFTEQDRSIVEEWQPSYRVTLSGTYGLDRFSVAAALHGYGPYTVLDGERQEYSAKYLTDLRFGYRLGFGRLSIGANNLFNVTPDEADNETARSGRLLDSQGNLIVDSPPAYSSTRAVRRRSGSTAASTTWRSTSISRRTAIAYPPAQGITPCLGRIFGRTSTGKPAGPCSTRAAA